MGKETGIGWCSKCGSEMTDATRSGHGRQCKSCRNAYQRSRYIKAGAPERHGPAPQLPRDGDKRQARQRINVEVRNGRRPHPNVLPCADCGHVWQPGERRHEYDHHKGYAPAHHYDVEPVCTTCHAKRDSAAAKKTHCKRGHEFTPGNTRIAKNGTRHCIACSQFHDAHRKPRKINSRKNGNTARRESNG